MQFLVDEDLGKRFSNILNTHGYKSLFVGDIIRSESDDKVLAFAEKKSLVILTGDKDFGELVFRRKKSAKGIILFRTLTTEPEKLFGLAKDILDKSADKFIVIEEGRIRVRKLK